MNWKEYMLSVGQGNGVHWIDDSECCDGSVCECRCDVVNNWKLYMLELIHDRELELGVDCDELECYRSIESCLMDCGDKLDVLESKLDSIIDNVLMLYK